MIKHIVLFNVKNELAEQKAEIKTEIKARLDALPAQIDVIESFEVGLNIVESDRSFDVALVSTFETLETLKTYAIHPKHLEATTYIREVCDRIVASDFEV